MWAFASEVSSADAKCEDLSYEMDDIDPKSRRLFWNCFEKSEDVFRNEYIADAKSELLLYEFIIWNEWWRYNNWTFVFKSEYCWWKMWDFVFKNEHIIDKKSEYLLFEMSGNGIDEKSKNLPSKMSIADAKCGYLLY